MEYLFLLLLIIIPLVVPVKSSVSRKTDKVAAYAIRCDEGVNVKELADKYAI